MATSPAGGPPDLAGAIEGLAKAATVGGSTNGESFDAKTFAARILRLAPADGRAIKSLGLCRGDVGKAEGIPFGTMMHLREAGTTIHHDGDSGVRLVGFRDVVVALTGVQGFGECWAVRRLADGEAVPDLPSLVASSSDHWLSSGTVAGREDPCATDPELAALCELASDMMRARGPIPGGRRAAVASLKIRGREDEKAGASIVPSDEGLLEAAMASAARGISPRRGWTRRRDRPEFLGSAWRKGQVVVWVDEPASSGSAAVDVAAREAARRRVLAWLREGRVEEPLASRLRSLWEDAR